MRMHGHDVRKVERPDGRLLFVPRKPSILDRLDAAWLAVLQALLRRLGVIRR